jgi:hypothetical protein
MAKTKLGLDEDFTPTQQVHKSKLWPLFKEAKAAGKRAFWRTVEFFVDGTQIFPPSSILKHEDQRPMCNIMEHA